LPHNILLKFRIETIHTFFKIYREYDDEILIWTTLNFEVSVMDVVKKL